MKNNDCRERRRRNNTQNSFHVRGVQKIEKEDVMFPESVNDDKDAGSKLPSFLKLHDDS